VVLELSSFQLWDVTASPHIAVAGMIEPEHLEVHRDMAEYVAAKSNIARFQVADDVVIYHPTNTYSAEIAKSSAAHTKLRYNTPDAAYIAGDVIKFGEQVICQTADVRLPGFHNLENICAAITAAWQYTHDVAATKRAIRAFTGLEHRLEFVRKYRDVRYYNDSISTTPGSVMAAINSFEPSHELLIVGGSYNKGVDFSALASHIASVQPKKIFFVGKIGAEIARLAQLAGYEGGEVYEEWSMQQVVQRLATQARAGDVVILSPAVASFGDFANYKDRGQQFKDIVRAL
jgi:UDP-N-acetylmuramoylalanine--D-glutamate ligase